jgi:predicted protein tyrosine phosphatase
MATTDRVLAALFCVEQHVVEWPPLHEIDEDSDFRLAAAEERVCTNMRRGRFCDFVYTMNTISGSVAESVAAEDEAIDTALAGLLATRADAPLSDALRLAGKLKLVYLMHEQELSPVVSQVLTELRVHPDPSRQRHALMDLLQGITDWGAFFHMSTVCERIPQSCGLAVSLRQLRCA